MRTPLQSASAYSDYCLIFSTCFTQSHQLMKLTTIETLAKENVFEIIGKEWMLITAGTPERFNMMTASWGGLGYLWNKPVAFLFVRPERFTYPFIEENDHLTLTFFGHSPEMCRVVNLCGTVSGRTHDKLKETGLTPVATEHGAVSFAEARLTVECRKLFRSDMKAADFIDQECLNRWYSDKPGGSFHAVYVVEIENVYEQ